MAREIKKLSARSVAPPLDTWPAFGWRRPLPHRRQGRRQALGVHLPLAGQAEGNGLRRHFSVSLADAREKAAEARKLVAAGRNPIDARKSAEVAAAAPTTFGDFADQLLEDIKSGFAQRKAPLAMGAYAGGLRRGSCALSPLMRSAPRKCWKC